MKIPAAGFTPLLLLCLSSCGKKDETVSCVKECAKIPATLSFSGYTADQLDTVIVVSYADENDLATPMKRDTLHNANLQIVNGIPRQGGSIFPFADVDAGHGYVITVPATGQRFTMTGIRRSGDVSIIICRLPAIATRKEAFSGRRTWQWSVAESSLRWVEMGPRTGSCSRAGDLL